MLFIPFTFFFIFTFFLVLFFILVKNVFSFLVDIRFFLDWFSVHLTVWFRLEIVAEINSGSRLPDPDYRRS